ncbi:kinase-like domain-containing protein [Glomus cerebriforme]|uniref:Kinase-like domain-containing protein n=1 Tax=Glomus cerebriforme TaxID=658196 RepID=A0A397T713_9GLOM|nr:kinase-like domain-containing protein [Glomus cerebriforme]
MAIIPFTDFIPLIDNVITILNSARDLYHTAEHNKETAALLIERISYANELVTTLQADEPYTENQYSNLQRFVQVLKRMENFIKEITHYNTLFKFFIAKSIKTHFEELRNEYDSCVISLNFEIAIYSKINAEKENITLRKEIESFRQFLHALTESVGKNFTDLSQKTNEMHGMINDIAKFVQIFSKSGANQKNIDDIFQETPLPFNEYNETSDKPRSERLRKYVHTRIGEDFAFKTIEKGYTDQVKNQVTILKRLKDCQNIIRFYGITSDGNQYYLITEWAENKNLREYINLRGQNIEMKLRIRFAYDIAKGLNFLNAAMIVHRDISAENIVITEHDIAKITNFKLSRRHKDDTKNVGVNEGRVAYCAPEILKRTLEGKRNENKKYDIKCEVYSFGIILWEIAECRVPYENLKSFMKIINKVSNGYRESFSSDNPISEKYKIIQKQAVYPNPALRPTFAKMLTDLKEIKDSPTSFNSSSSIPSVEYTEKSIDIEIDKAVEEYKKNIGDKSKLYLIFDKYANMNVPKAKYWKAYLIHKVSADLRLEVIKRF